MYSQFNELKRDVSIESEPLSGISAKRQKRRKDMVERVEKLRDDTRDRKDRIFHELSLVHVRIAEELLPPPVFPAIHSVNNSLALLPPSLPYTNPIIPDMYPRPYLFALHRLSHQRSNQLLAGRMFHDHQKVVANKIYDIEISKIEEEYELAMQGVKTKLIEALIEKKRKLVEEKASEVFNTLPIILTENGIETSRSHGTRKLRQPASKTNATPPPATSSSNYSSNSTRDTSTPESDSNLTIYGQLPPSTRPILSLSGKLLDFTGVSDPFDLALSLLPSTTSNLLSSINGGTPSTSFLSNSAGYGKKKVPKSSSGPRTQPGLPPAHFQIQSGIYPHQLGKSLNGLSSLKSDDIESDLNSMKRKRGLGRN